MSRRAVSRVVSEGYEHEYLIKDGRFFDLTLSSPPHPRDIHVDTALRLESGSDIIQSLSVAAAEPGRLESDAI
jgi:hypothetical protein